jgi:hypothetical protein
MIYVVSEKLRILNIHECQEYLHGIVRMMVLQHDVWQGKNGVEMV